MLLNKYLFIILNVVNDNKTFFPTPNFVSQSPEELNLLKLKKINEKKKDFSFNKKTESYNFGENNTIKIKNKFKNKQPIKDNTDHLKQSPLINSSNVSLTTNNFNNLKKRYSRESSITISSSSSSASSSSHHSKKRKKIYKKG